MEDLYAYMDTPEIAAHLNVVAQNAVQYVEDYMRQDRDGFLDKAAEERAVDEVAGALSSMLDPNWQTTFW